MEKMVIVAEGAGEEGLQRIGLGRDERAVDRLREKCNARLIQGRTAPACPSWTSWCAVIRAAEWRYCRSNLTRGTMRGVMILFLS